eukprot:1140771-Rhodomonas_salina.1
MLQPGDLGQEQGTGGGQPLGRHHSKHVNPIPAIRLKTCLLTTPSTSTPGQREKGSVEQREIKREKERPQERAGAKGGAREGGKGWE